MATCMICYPNRADAAVLTDPDGAWSAMPVANLQTRWLSEYARTGGLPAYFDEQGQPYTARIDVAFDGSRYIVAAALCKHNFSLNATIRLVFWGDAACTVPLYDSGYQPIWTRYCTWRLCRWGDSNFWGGHASLDQISAVPPTAILMLPGRTPARYVTLFINDPVNPDGYLQAGRLYMAESWIPSTNMTFGATLGVVDPSNVDETLSGTELAEERSKYRQAVFKLPYLGLEEGVNIALGMDLDRGITKDVLFIWDPANSLLMQMRSFVGRLQELSPLEFPSVGMTGKSYKIKELI